MHERGAPGRAVCAIARAGAGVNNIPLNECAEKGIVVFNTPGANANGVKELVLAGMLLASRDIVGGIEVGCTGRKIKSTSASLPEKQKKQFAGCEIQRQKAWYHRSWSHRSHGGKRSHAVLAWKYMGYDPYLSIDAAWNLSSNHQAQQEPG